MTGKKKTHTKKYTSEITVRNKLHVCYTGTYVCKGKTINQWDQGQRGLSFVPVTCTCNKGSVENNDLGHYI